MTLTGHQIRDARALLGLTRSALAYHVRRITTLAILRAEEAGEELTLSAEQSALVRQTLESLGIDFSSESPVIRLRKVEHEGEAN